MTTGYEFNWVTGASCIGADPELFFPRLQGVDQPQVQEAQAICNECPVRETCLEYALENEDPADWRRYGIFGGLTPRQRNVLIQERGGPSQRPPRRPAVDLTNAVDDIAERYRAGDTIRVIADDYACSTRSIHRLLRGRTDITMRSRGGYQPRREAS